MPETREWTVMFYLASDNPLAPGIISHLKAIKNAGYHPEVNVLAQFDPHTVNTPVHIFDVNRIEKLKNPNEVNIGFRANDPFIRNLVTDKIWDDEVSDKIRKQLQGRLPGISFKPPRLPSKTSDELSPRESLENFLHFCRRHYPARHYMLFIVGHGMIVGNDLFLIDQHVTTKNGNSEQALRLIELAEILDGFNKRLVDGAQLELVGFHSCSMSGAEVAFELEGKANYMLAAQGPTYIGAWPYRQILIRLFNDLNSSSPFTRDDISANGLLDRLMKGKDPACQFFRNRFNENGKAKLLSQHAGGPPKPKLVTAMAREFDALLTDPNLHQVEQFTVNLSPNTRQLVRKHRKAAFDERYLRWLNRRLLLETFPERVVRADTATSIKRLVVNIFHYCLYNSFDFQLAGYSCDVTLCDLTKVHNMEQRVADLASSLRKGLKSSKATKDPLIRDLIILAHWEAQSFYEEKYTDLYDFCFRLKAKCEEAKPSSSETERVIQKIKDACLEVMTVLKRGARNDGDGVIVRSEFLGPAYQYSHGMSVFFPWSEPVDSEMWDKYYKDYEFNKKTQW
jgi:Clostripain family